MNHSRRDLARILPLLAVSAAAGEENPVATSKVFRYEDLPVRRNGANAGRNVFNGATHSGYPVDLHLTELGPGQEPHPPHKHVHEEIMMLESGVLEVTIGGKTTRITPGSVVYAASNEEHGWRNPGPGRAQYFVLALGRDKA